MIIIEYKNLKISSLREIFTLTLMHVKHLFGKKTIRITVFWRNGGNLPAEMRTIVKKSCFEQRFNLLSIYNLLLENVLFSLFRTCLQPGLPLETANSLELCEDWTVAIREIQKNKSSAFFAAVFKTLAQVSGLNLRISLLSFLEVEGLRPPCSRLDAVFNDDIWESLPLGPTRGRQTWDAAHPSINKWIINCVNPS